MTFLKNITYNEIIEGKKILDICERKLEKFSFMDNKDFESPGLRKFLLVSNLSNLATNIINSGKEYNFRDNNIKQKRDDRYILKPNIFDGFNGYKTRDNTKNIQNFEYKTTDVINPDYDDDEEFLDDFYEEGEELSDDNTDDDDESSQEIYVITNSSYDNNNNGYLDTSECYENNEKEEDRNANSYLEDLRFADHNYEKMSSVVVSVASKVASKNIHEISVSSHLGKHSLNFDEEIITSTVAYKKAKHI
ncbi:unnamed protein product [Rhizophagus irregularis]|uniref:Uncharacterized protein n=1 Tax=Rhizophagus irregularis TaxID=588596 RepID=A0A2N1NW29_9GLOM|nr:hypothetical protein RhiirC2_835524 [Rhizophagus irregularis]CAB4389666.1 unnamed protein product [Rhizophagus irregularis]CAB5371082.1 unnamed protein product [Rhizophagus irregularis]